MTGFTAKSYGATPFPKILRSHRSQRKSAVVNQQLTVDVQASEPGNPSATLAYSLIDGPPQGASITSSSGVFTWTPAPAETPGVYELTVQVTDTSDPGDLTSSASFQVTVSAGPASKLVITSPALDLSTGSMGQLTLALEDQYGDQGAVSSTSQTISLASTSFGGAFYATQTSTTPITSMVIPAGQSTASVYYADTSVGSPTLTLSDMTLDSAPMQQETVTPGMTSQVAFTSASVDIVQGTLGQIMIALEDSYGNPAPSASNETINLSTTSSGGAFYASLTSTTPITSITIHAGDTSARRLLLGCDAR